MTALMTSHRREATPARRAESGGSFCFAAQADDAALGGGAAEDGAPEGNRSVTETLPTGLFASLCPHLCPLGRIRPGLAAGPSSFPRDSGGHTVELMRIELTTSSMPWKRSSQLSYSPVRGSKLAPRLAVG